MKIETLKVKDVLANPANTRSAAEFTKTNLRALADSIKQFGVAVPIIVQKVADGYMLVAGHRRLAAAKLAKIEEIPAIIVNGDTKLAPEAIAFLENQHRRDLTVIEEIKAVVTLLESGDDVAAIAYKLGLTMLQVRLRKNIIESLDPAWVKQIEAGNLGWITPPHLDLIARMPASTQRELLGELINEFEPVPVRSLEIRLKDYQHDLKSAPWNVDVDPCASCEKRSDKIGQGELFVTGTHKKKTILCLDAECYEHSALDYHANLYKEAVKSHPDLTVLNIYQNADQAFKYDLLETLKHDGAKHIEFPDNWKKVKEGTKKAVPMFVVGGPDTGCVKWMLSLVARKNADGSEVAKPGRKKLESTDDKLENLHGLRLKIVYHDLIATIENIRDFGMHFDQTHLAAFLAVFGSYGCGRSLKKDEKTVTDLAAGKKAEFNHPWDNKEKPMDATLGEIMWEQCRRAIVREIPFDDTAQKALDAEKFCKWIGSSIGFDWTQSLNAAVIAKPEPKSWTKSKQKQQ